MPFTLQSFNPDRDFPADDDSDSSSSSSLGRNSISSEEDFSDREDSGVVELQRSFKNSLGTMNDLEEDLPVKRGISKFYSGKSKSFTSLAEAETVTCVQEIVKPEDPYAKKRKDLLAHNILLNRSRSYADNVGGISKRPGPGGSCLTLSSLGSNIGDNEEGKISTSISPPCPLPPHPHAKRASANSSAPCPTRNSAWRTYSWSDLQSVTAEAHDISGLAICNGNKGNKVH